MSLVEAVSWDITLGAATSGLGQLILGATSDSSQQIPEAVDHVGLKVFGFLYEYGDLGILKSQLPPDGQKLTSKYPAFKLRAIEELGSTEKTQDEFEAWVEEQNVGDFRGSNYNVVNNSCVVWARQAAEFLQVTAPTNWDKVIQWAERNKKFTSLVGATGMGSRQVQHKATEYVTDPSKIKAKAKRLYRKIRRKRSIILPPEDGEDVGATVEVEEEIEVEVDEDYDDIDSSEENEEGIQVTVL